MYCTSKGKVKYYETGWIVLELVLDRHSVERVVRAYTAARTERSMLVHENIFSSLNIDYVKFIFNEIFFFHLYSTHKVTSLNH